MSDPTSDDPRVPRDLRGPDHAATHALGMMTDGPQAYITGQEAAGQAEMVAATVLPIRTVPEGDAPFEALGIVFGAPVDDLFREATLPPGWTRQGTDHAMWSSLVDAHGVERVAVFYKASWYDRRAHMMLREAP